MECSKREKPCRLSIDSITKVTYWPRFLLNACEERHNTSYRDRALFNFSGAYSQDFKVVAMLM